MKIYKCHVPNCSRKSSDIGVALHKIPKNPDIRKQWVESCNLTRAVGSKTFICSDHFKKSDYFLKRLGHKMNLKKTAVPSLNPKTKFIPKILRSSNVKSMSTDNTKCNIHADEHNEIPTVESNNVEDSETQPEENVLLTDSENPGDCEECKSDEIEDDAEESAQDAMDENDVLLEIQNASMDSDREREIVIERASKICIGEAVGGKKNLLSLIRNDEDLIAFTGVSFQLLESLTKGISICEERLSKKFSNTLQERIVLCLCKLRLNLSFRCLAVLFGLTRQSCSNNFYYMVQLMSEVLKDFVYWPTKEEISNSMPLCFNKFKKTYVVLDCTEVPVEKPRCLRCRLRLYSHYKGCETIKLLIGVAPCGLIIFLSNAYGGRASDKAIFNQSGILNKLEPTRDAIMVDKGFDIELECMQNFIQLIMPPKLEKKEQLSAEEALLTNSIAAARVHVERSIQRFKMFHIVKHKIPWTLIPYIDNICTVVAALVNLKNPLFADNKF